MKKHLLASLCVGMLVSLPACMGPCAKKEEVAPATAATEVDVKQTEVAPVLPTEPAQGEVAPTTEVPNKI